MFYTAVKNLFQIFQVLIFCVGERDAGAVIGMLEESEETPATPKAAEAEGLLEGWGQEPDGAKTWAAVFLPD